jgi:acetylornithine deacetylase
VLPYRTFPSYNDLVNTGYIDILNYKNRPNVVGRLKGSGGGKSLIINGHIDTISVGAIEQWTTDPYGSEIKDNKIYGRGTSDMKGGLIAAISAIKCFIELGIHLSGDVIIESVVNEEHSGNGALACVEKGINADAVIVVEPTDNEVYVAQSGNLYWEVTLKGKPRHTGARWVNGTQVGVSAIEKVPKVIDALLAMEYELNNITPHPLYDGKSSCSLVFGKIIGGTYETLTAGECKVRGSTYFAPNVGTVVDVMERMRIAVKKASENDPWLKNEPPELQFLHHRFPSEISVSEPIVETIRSASEKVLGFKPKAVGAHMPADQSFFINQANIPGVVFGPGSLAQAHIIDEYLEIKELINFTKSLALIIYNWCK